MAAVGDVRRSEAEEVRRAAILPEDAIARLMKPIRSGQSAAWCAAAGLTGFGAASLLQAPDARRLWMPSVTSLTSSTV